MILTLYIKFSKKNIFFILLNVNIGVKHVFSMHYTKNIKIMSLGRLNMKIKKNNLYIILIILNKIFYIFKLYEYNIINIILNGFFLNRKFFIKLLLKIMYLKKLKLNLFIEKINYSFNGCRLKNKKI